jgi:hypothetical protein
MAQTYDSLRRMVQNFPVKQIQQIFCLMCTALGYIVLLKDQTPRQDVQVSSNTQRHVQVCAVAAGKIIIMDVRNPSTTFLTCYTFITTPYTSVNWRWILMAKICFARKKKTWSNLELLRGTKLLTLLLLIIKTSFLTCYTFITTPHNSVNWRWILMAKICFARKKKTW